MALIFRWLETTTLPVRGESLKPETFASMTAAEAARVRIGLGNTTTEIGELFRVEGEPGDNALTFEGDLSHVQGLGSGMSAGTLVIQGSVGPMLGSRMSGGTIDVHGSAGDWAGAEISGGLIRIRGDAGDFVGAAYPGSRLGMKDGAILIDGSAGEDVGLSMRRGLIVVRGNAAAGLGRSMIAGTLILGGRAGQGMGAGMKRGSLVLLDPGREAASELMPTFTRAGCFPPTFLIIYQRQFEAWGFSLPVPDSVLMAPCERYNGDTLIGGQGEILLLSTSS